MQKQTKEILLRELKKDKDGFYHIILYTLVENAHTFDIERLTREISDNPSLETAILDLHSKLVVTIFCREIRSIVQESIKSIITSGYATYKFISVVAYIVDNSWLSTQLEPNASTKIKVLYFFKQLEPIALEPNTQISRAKKQRLLKKYLEYAKKSSKLLVNILNSNEKILSEDNVILKELKNSF